MFSLIPMKHWLQTRTPQELIGVLLAGMIVCLTLWYIIWEGSYHNKYSALKQQMIPLETKKAAMDRQNSELKKMLENPETRKKYGVLLNQLNDLNAQIEAISTHLVSSAEMVKALKNILVEEPELSLIHLENTNNILMKFPPEVTDAALTKSKFYRHDFVIELNGNYFATLSYLKKLEALPWQFYWDAINYKVIKAPEAKITIKLHTISTEEGLMNV